MTLVDRVKSTGSISIFERRLDWSAHTTECGHIRKEAATGGKLAEISGALWRSTQNNECLITKHHPNANMPFNSPKPLQRCGAT